jgi:hypothetical protein
MTLLVATRKGLFSFTQSGKDWALTATDFIGDNVTLAVADPRDGTVYAALDHGHFGVKLHRQTGGIWEEIAAPAYPPKPEGYEEDDIWGKPLNWTTTLIWALSPGGADQPGLMWCGTTPGGLFRSTDRGASWELVRSLWDHASRRKWGPGGIGLPGIHGICVHPTDSKQIALGVSTGGVWHTNDGGASWEQRGDGMRAEYMPPEQAHDPAAQDVHCLVQCQSAPDRMWVQHHNGMFVSSDAGRTFSEIHAAGPSTFGFAAAVHPREPDTAWFVPEIKDEKRIPKDGKLVVTRTRDGGKSFDVLTEGLPQAHAYDVVLRHALDVDASGDRLAFGSTTGNLWASTDQGDHWVALSHTLPPIYAVRFAAASLQL